MAKRSKVSQLPPALKAWLDEQLIKGNFSNYEQLAVSLRAKGEAIGVPVDASKSGIHRYGANLERKLSAIKASTEAAVLIAKMAPDEEDNRSGAVLSMIQTEVFEALLALKDADVEIDPTVRAKLLSGVAKNFAAVTNSSIGLKRYQASLREKANAAAASVEQLARKSGVVSDDLIAQFRAKILGIAT